MYTYNHNLGRCCSFSLGKNLFSHFSSMENASNNGLKMKATLEEAFFQDVLNRIKLISYSRRNSTVVQFCFPTGYGSYPLH